MSTAQSLRDKWAAGGTAFGAWAALPDAFASELMCVPGVDYVCIDQQHGLVDYSDMVAMLRAIEGRKTVALTRVAANEGWLIGKALDAGIQGVVVPMVSTGARKPPQPPRPAGTHRRARARSAPCAHRWCSIAAILP